MIFFIPSHFISLFHTLNKPKELSNALVKNEESAPHRWPRNFSSSEIRYIIHIQKRSALSLSPFQFPTINPSTRSKGERGHEDGAPPPQLLHLPSPFLSSPNGRLSHPPLWVPHLCSLFLMQWIDLTFFCYYFFLSSNGLGVGLLVRSIYYIWSQIDALHLLRL